MDNRRRTSENRSNHATTPPAVRAGRRSCAGRRLAAVDTGLETEVSAAPSVTVNGRERLLGEVGGHVTLLDWLRAEGLTGSKEGCAEGECGACAVLVLRPRDGGDTDRGADGDASAWVAVNACLAPAAALDGQGGGTAEGLGRPPARHPGAGDKA